MIVPFLLSTVLWAQGGAADPGPKAGERIPAFSLQDQTGQSRDLKSLAGPKGLMLVFTRSADW